MSAAGSIFQKSNRRIAALALVVLALDQFTKWLVLKWLPLFHEKIIVPGFFKFVHWDNTGAAWSLFSGNNGTLVVVMLLAFVALFLTRHHFDVGTLSGQIAFGLLFGGIAGNLTDRLLPGRHAVVDFIRFYMQLRGGYGGEIGFPAFNVADTAICTGVGLIFLITWKNEHAPKTVTSDR
jgi:signal peptidase II